MKLRTDMNGRNSEKKVNWKNMALAGGALALSACGDYNVDNFVPIPGKKDASASDFRTDGAAKLDSVLDVGRKDGGVDAKYLDAARDYKLTDGVVDKGASDACVAASGTLYCSNGSSVASAWLSLGSTIDIKDSPYAINVVYKLRFEGVETVNSTTSAIVSLLDSCGKVVKKDKIALNSTKSITTSGQQIDVTLEGLYSGSPSNDGGSWNGQAKLSVKVPCNLDGGTADSKSAADSKPYADSKTVADSKIAADSKTVADSKPASPDMKLVVDSAPKADSKPVSADMLPADSKPTADSTLAADSKPASDSKPKADSTVAKDSSASNDLSKSDGSVQCASLVNATFSGLAYVNIPVTLGGLTATYKGMNAGGDALFDLKCGSYTIASGKVCPEDVVTTITQDGKKILVTPHTVRADKVDTSIQVK